ncbi:hypothetical protein EUX98_g2315 [Antrodiella citrinella]|uniref:DUF6593 domain-containing protein n=1 Tax=Antrodiella citrinella TaxID=2447956 RepID=A0A4S4N7J3_9APHY|nr:hypothetical protein EUX98_g2315 [Antrodiella citrinella]
MSPPDRKTMRQRLTLTTTSLHNVVISNKSDVIYYEIVTPKWERHLTKVSRLDPNTRQFNLIGELQNQDDKPVAVRLYGGTFKKTKEFLKDAPSGASSEDTTHTPKKEPQLNSAVIETLVAKSLVAGPSSEVQETSVREIESVGVAEGSEEVDQKRHRHKWCEAASFNGKDGRKYTWRGDHNRLELLREDMPDRPVATYHRQKRYFYVLRMSQHPYLEVDAAAMDTLDSLICLARPTLTSTFALGALLRILCTPCFYDALGSGGGGMGTKCS